jgi:hypothetical protein
MIKCSAMLTLQHGIAVPAVEIVPMFFRKRGVYLEKALNFLDKVFHTPNTNVAIVRPIKYTTSRIAGASVILSSRVIFFILHLLVLVPVLRPSTFNFC